MSNISIIEKQILDHLEQRLNERLPRKPAWVIQRQFKPIVNLDGNNIPIPKGSYDGFVENPATGKKILIEVDGEYFHAKASAKNSDLKKDMWALYNRHVLLRIPADPKQLFNANGKRNLQYYLERLINELG